MTGAISHDFAAWMVAAMMGDGMDLWLVGDVIHYHGPEEARARWAKPMGKWQVPLRVYLALECWPARSEP